MSAISLISQDLFDKIRGQFPSVELGDKNGNITTDPKDACFFDFDFVVNGNILGRVTISINQPGCLKLFYVSGILRDQSKTVQEFWYNFLKDMRQFSKSRLLRYDTRDIERSNLNKNDFKFLSKLSESNMTKRKRISYHKLEETMLVVKHSKNIDPNLPSSSSRNIQSIMICNNQGERFKFPFSYLLGARAMQRHVCNGGSPYDQHGQAIVNMCEMISKLCKFKRKTKSYKDVSEQSRMIMDAVEYKLKNLRETVKKLCNQKFYETWHNGFYERPSELIIDDITSKIYKEAFTRNYFVEEIAEYFPLIHQIMKEANVIDLDEYTKETDTTVIRSNKSSNYTLKEVDEYDNWASSVVDLSSDVIDNLKELLNSEIKVGVDGTNVIQSLRGIGINNRELEEMIRDAGTNGDLNTIISMWLSKNNQQSVLTQLNLKNQKIASKPKNTDVNKSSNTDIDNKDTELPEPNIDNKDTELPEPNIDNKDTELPEPDLKEEIIRLAGLKNNF